MMFLSRRIFCLKSNFSHCLSRTKFETTSTNSRTFSSSKSSSGDEDSSSISQAEGKTQPERDLEQVKPWDELQKSNLIKRAKGGVPLNKDDYLPKDRPWEGEKPESEILKIPDPPKWVNMNRFEVSVNDDMLKAVNVPIGLWAYKYPQFKMDTDPFPDRKSGREIVGSMTDIVTYNPEVTLPDQSDILVIGGGVMGASIAYMLKERVKESLSITVLEKDPTYSKASTTLSVGGIRQQFSLKENIQMSMFTSNFLRNAKEKLTFLDNEPPDFAFNLSGYLLLATAEKADTLLDNHKTQVESGAFVDILNQYQLAQRFPWLNTDRIVLGAHGVQNEGWFDPWSLLISLKGKAEFLGANFLNAEFLDFNLKRQYYSQGDRDDTGLPPEICQYAIYRLPTGEERQIRFAHVVIAAGAESGEVAKKLGIGTEETGIRSIPLPVEKRKRYVYVFHCPDGPELDFPFLCDPSGVYCRREGLGGRYICGKCPDFEDEPSTDNLDVDYEFFENQIWPVLAHRVKAFERLKIVGAWAGFYDYNYFDQNAVIGYHPYFHNVFWATGFSGHGIQMGPAVGRAFTEMMLDQEYTSLDLSRLGWERILNKRPLRETNIF